MQPRVTVALATVWLTVAGLVGGAVTLRLSHDQYSPATPHHHAGVQRDQTGDWKDHEPAEDQPLDLWIGSRRSISAEESPVREAKFVEQDFPFEMPLKDIVSSKRAYPLSNWQRWLPNITAAEFAADKVDYGYEMPETLSRGVVIPPSDLLDDHFVADDTFQDQGPGSLEIYKLDLSKEKALLTASTPSANSPSRNKSKAPKKTGHLSAKTKTMEIKSTTMSPKIHHRQSNFFEEQRTETPSVNRDSFGVGGVPELQVGCEGLEALSSHKAKRSIDTPGNENGQLALLNVTPVSLDLNYDISYNEESYEEMDELFKLKKLETTTKGNKPNRGDMDASYLNSDHLDEPKRPDKLPVRGDLGESISKNSSKLKIGQKNEPQKQLNSEIKRDGEIKVKRDSVSSQDDDDTSSRNRGRRLLWLAEVNTVALADGKSERKRARRSIDWGYGENEGVVSSDELQTLSQRRRQHDIRYYQDVSRRRDQHQNGVNPEIDSIRREYEKLLEQRRREDEEQRRRMQQGGRSRWEEERREDETQRRQHEDYNRRTNYLSRVDDEDTQQRQTEEQQTQKPERDHTLKIARKKEEEQRRRQEKEMRRRQEEEMRRQQEEEMRRRQHNRWQGSTERTPESATPASDEEKRRLYDEQIRRREEERQRRLQEEARRQEQYRWQEELQKRKDEEERRRQDSLRNSSENDKRRLEEHRKRESEKRRQEEEDERRRQQAPSSLTRPGSRISNPNDIRQHDRDEERRAREQEERRREQKLREYIARNRPINVSRAEGRSEEERRHNRPEESRDPRVSANRNDEEYRRRVEEQRRRQDEERKLQDYIRRNQPMNVPSRSNQSTATDRDLLEERRLIEEARRRDRYPDPGARRQHGPLASTYIDPRSSPEEVRRRQQETARRLEEERRQRYEAEERRKELARRQREKEEERRLREERMRKEAARREEETRREQSRRYEEERRRQEEASKQASNALQRRQERRREEARISTKETRQPEVARPTYDNPRLLAEHRRRQDSRPIPNNLVRNQNDRRIKAERERQRQEAERRQQRERMRENGQKGTDQWRRQETARLNSLPVSARIIVRPDGTSRSVSPVVISKIGSDNEIDFTGINPHREGVKVPQFPVPPTRRPPIPSPGPCIWAVVQCCSINNNRLVKCFESMGCPGINWDPNPCRSSIANAARMEVMKFYENQ